MSGAFTRVVCSRLPNKAVLFGSVGSDQLRMSSERSSSPCRVQRVDVGSGPVMTQRTVPGGGWPLSAGVGADIVITFAAACSPLRRRMHSLSQRGAQ